MTTGLLPFVGCGDDTRSEVTPASSDCASFTPQKGLWSDEPRLRWNRDQVDAEAAQIISCRVLIGQSEREITTLLGAQPVKPRDLGGDPGDNFRIWRWRSGPALYVTFDRSRAAGVDIERTECDRDVWDCDN